MILSLAGCVSAPLSSVPIIGGTDELRDAVRSELVDFDQYTSGGRASVARVVISDQNPIGSWNTITHIVHLDDGLTISGTSPIEPSITQVLRHELCHALNHKENIHLEERTLYAERGRELQEANLLLDRAGPGRLEDETLAAYCSLGPWIARLASGPCPDDAALTSRDVLSHLSERIWTGANQPLSSTIDDHEQAQFDASILGFDVLREVSITSSAERPDDLRIEWVDVAGRYGDAVVNSASGTLSLDPDRQPFLASGELEPPDPLILVETGQQYPDGVATFTVMIPLFDEPPLIREVWSDGILSFSIESACQQQSKPFPLHDQAFAVLIDGTFVRWLPIHPE